MKDEQPPPHERKHLVLVPSDFKVLTKDRGWVRVDELVTGDKLVDPALESVTIVVGSG